MNKVKIMTFKDSGKWYDTFEVEYENNPKNWYDVIDEITHKKKQGLLPQSSFKYVLLVSDEDKYGFPHMID